MSLQNHADTISAVTKTAVGVTGTTLSFFLENVSTVVSIIAGVATALFMFQQFLNARKKAKQLEVEND